MGYVRRTSLPDGYFHVYARGVCGVPPFPTPQDRTALLGMLLKSARRFDVEVEAACVLTTHYHAVLRTACADLSRALQWLHSRYARAFNRRNGRFGHVFAERFQCRVVDEDQVFDRCGYVLGNPVKAGLCDRIEDWPWSYSRHGLDRA
ncbi:MAG TPA: transposase [Gaiellaceae bacterium]|nr:transposase [Gaiellaceae bacterium]